MANKTANYGLTKPLPEEFYDVGVQNANMDIIDTELKKRAILGEDGKVPEEQLPDTTNIPVTSEIPSDSDIWIDPDDEAVEETHITNKNNPHGVTPAQIGAAPAIESTIYPGCYYRMVNGEQEWLNPPMAMGQEYRTAERWRGEVVYAKHVGITSGENATFGNGSTAVDYTISSSFNGLHILVRTEANMETTNGQGGERQCFSLPHTATNGGWIGISEVKSTGVVFRTNKYQTANWCTINANVYYTKG